MLPWRRSHLVRTFHHYRFSPACTGSVAVAALPVHDKLKSRRFYARPSYPSAPSFTIHWSSNSIRIGFHQQNLWGDDPAHGQGRTFWCVYRLKFAWPGHTSSFHPRRATSSGLKRDLPFGQQWSPHDLPRSRWWRNSNDSKSAA